MDEEVSSEGATTIRHGSRGAHLKKELARVKEERDILKKGETIDRHWFKNNGEATSPTSAPGLLIHSDQGTQYTSREWAAFLRDHKIEHSMSRRGNCHEFKDGLRSRSDDLGDHLKSQNAVAEDFFQLLKREKIRRRKYRSRDKARSDVFEYIELFYNPKRKHTNNGMLSPPFRDFGCAKTLPRKN